MGEKNVTAVHIPVMHRVITEAAILLFLSVISIHSLMVIFIIILQPTEIFNIYNNFHAVIVKIKVSPAFPETAKSLFTKLISAKT